MTHTHLFDRLELFFGEATAAEARIYARLDESQLPADATLSGQLIGPECQFARTLPAKIPFQFRGHDASRALLAEAIVPDPCLWTPELPMLYRVEIRGEHRGVSPTCQHDVAPTERWFGIRRLGTRGQSFILDGKRWVLRGIFRERRAAGFIPAVDGAYHALSPDLADFITARAEDAALVVTAADDEFCLEASRQGVPLVVMVSGPGPELTAEIRRLGKWPAVFMVVLDPDQPTDFDPRLLARNLLFATHYRADKPLGSSTWGHVLWCEIEGELAPVRCGDSPRPIIAVRRLHDQADIATARSACDRLQSDSAPLGDFAGYAV